MRSQRASLLNKMMLGFVVRQCAVARGHPPRAEELAAWANSQRDHRGTSRLFGRPISVEDAQVLLRHPERPVTVRRLFVPEEPTRPHSPREGAPRKVVLLRPRAC